MVCNKWSGFCSPSYSLVNEINQEKKGTLQVQNAKQIPHMHFFFQEKIV
jgi:hypothetical protein